MNIALLGATGAVGGHFLTKALAAGYAVKALVRTPEKLRKDASLSELKGDVANPVDVAELIRGTDVVVSCLGNVKGMLIMEKAAEVILQTAAEQSKPPKCLFISSIGCGGTSWDTITTTTATAYSTMTPTTSAPTDTDTPPAPMTTPPA